MKPTRELLVFLEQRCDVDAQKRLHGRQQIGAVTNLTSRLTHTLVARRGRMANQNILLATHGDYRTILWPANARQAHLLVQAVVTAWKEVSRHRVVVVYAPGVLGSLGAILSVLRRRPLIVVVVGDPAEALSAEVLPGRVGTFARNVLVQTTRFSCSHASVIRYVTERTLQMRYPSHVRALAYAGTDALGDFDVLPKASRRPPPFRILTVATLEQPYKGVAELIDAVALLRSEGYDMDLCIAGDGRLAAALQTIGHAQLGQHCKFLGHLDQVNLAVEYVNSDIFALASWAEGLPRAMVEAMFHGLPVVSTTVGGIPELLDQRFLCKPRDAGALAKVLASLVDVQDEWDAIGAHNAQRARALIRSSREADSAFTEVVVQLARK